MTEVGLASRHKGRQFVLVAYALIGMVFALSLAFVATCFCPVDLDFGNRELLIGAWWINLPGSRISEFADLHAGVTVYRISVGRFRYAVVWRWGPDARGFKT